MTTPSGILVTAEEDNKKKKKILIPKIVAYLSLLRWSHALRSDQKLKSTPSQVLGLAKQLSCVLPSRKAVSWAYG